MDAAQDAGYHWPLTANEAPVPRPEVMLPADGLIAVVKRDCLTCELIAPMHGRTLPRMAA